MAPNNDKPKSSIADLKIYQLARSLEDQVYELVKAVPPELFYPLGNDLRRASAAVAHYISETHKRYSYHVKVESLHAARNEAEQTIKLLEQLKAGGDGPAIQQVGSIGQLIEDYTTVIKQSWGLVKYLKRRQTEKQATATVKAKDELVAARP